MTARSPTGWPRTSAEDRDRAFALIAGGASLGSAAAAVGMSESGLGKAMRRAGVTFASLRGIERPASAPPMSIAQRSAAIRRVCDGASLAVAAQSVGVSKSALAHMLNRRGLSAFDLRGTNVRRAPSVLPLEKRERAFRLIGEGMPVHRAAASVGVSYATLWRAIRTCKLSVPALRRLHRLAHPPVGRPCMCCGGTVHQNRRAGPHSATAFRLCPTCRQAAASGIGV